MPALQLAQERNGGWLSEQSFRDVADALDLTPGLLPLDRDVLRHVPPGARRRAPDRGLHEHLLRAQGRAAGGRGVRERARHRGGRDDGRVHAARGRVPRRVRLGDDRRDRQPAPAARAGRRRAAASWPSCAGSNVRRRTAMATTPEIVFAGTNGGALTEIADYEAVGGFQALAKSRTMTPGRDHRGAQRLEPARPRRRLLPDRPQVELRAEAGQDRQAALPRDQRRRVGAGHVQGPRDHAPRPVPVPRGVADRRPRDRVDARLHLHPRRVRGGVRGARLRARADAREAAPRRRHDRPPPRRRRLHLRRGDGAARVARRAARPAADEAAVPRHRRPLRLTDRGQQRRVDHERDLGARDRRRRVREARHRELDRARASSRSRATSSTAATTSCPTASRCAT